MFTKGGAAVGTGLPQVTVWPATAPKSVMPDWVAVKLPGLTLKIGAPTLRKKPHVEPTPVELPPATMTSHWIVNVPSPLSVMSSIS